MLQQEIPLEKKDGVVLSVPATVKQPLTARKWYKNIEWFNFAFSIGIPILAFTQAYNTSLQPKTLLFAFVYYCCTGISISAGYHRLWSHRAYSATKPLKLIFAIFGAGAVQGSILWWCKGHRAHHRYTDTDKDPYSAHKGLFYSHIGWILVKRPRDTIGRADISDLREDPIVTWQHRHYIILSLSFGILIPWVICGLGWGDWRGGLIYAAIIRMFCLQQAIFCVNSLAHYLGTQPFDDRRTARDHILTALITFGEGYHNFHHSFPSDYRNGAAWYQYDPSKWILWLCERVGLVGEVQRFGRNEIDKMRLQQQEKKLDAKKKQLQWGTPIDQLSVMSWNEFQAQCKLTESGDYRRELIVIAGVVYDVHGFVKSHPGGETLICSGIGKDCTAIFNGAVYDHSHNAYNLLALMRVAVLDGGGRIEKDCVNMA